MLAGAMGLLDSVKLLVAYCADLELKSLHGTADEYAYALRNKDIGDYIKRARGEKRQCKTPARRSWAGVWAGARYCPIPACNGAGNAHLIPGPSVVTCSFEHVEGVDSSNER